MTPDELKAKRHEIILGLVLDWGGSLQQPEIARAVLLPSQLFDAFTARLVRAMVVWSGDWQSAARWMRERGLIEAGEGQRLEKFLKWAAGLKGGAK